MPEHPFAPGDVHDDGEQSRPVARGPARRLPAEPNDPQARPDRDRQANYERCTQILAELEDADRAAGALHSTPRGTLRLYTGASLARSRHRRSAVARFELDCQTRRPRPAQLPALRLLFDLQRMAFHRPGWTTGVGAGDRQPLDQQHGDHRSLALSGQRCPWHRGSSSPTISKKGGS